jgi:hypothetical protein
MQSLPLSWALTPNNNFANEIPKLSFNNLVWVPYRTLETKAHFYNFISQQTLQSSNDLIIRGCNKYHVEELSKRGFSSTKIGIEAILETSKNHFEKKSLTSLVKRGLRNGKVKQLTYSYEISKQFNEFKKQSVHSHKPQLQNLFQTNFTSNNLLYIFESKQNEWLGAILLSVNSKEKLHTELILRKPNAPVGIIEALVYTIFFDAKNNGFKKVSLGEVPFITKEKTKIKNYRVYIVVKLGTLFRFAYNYKGLYNFKNKFNPNWEFVYISVKPKLKLKHFAFLFVQSNLHKLVLFQLKEKLKNIKKIYNYPNFILRLLDFN